MITTPDTHYAKISQEGSIGNEREDSQELLRELSLFDSSLAERIRDAENGVYRNGHSPNGVLTEALKGQAAREQDFLDEYEWALNLAIYPYAASENRRALMLAAEDGLFMAAASYDPQKEPNFLRHLSKVASDYLERTFGQAKEAELPSADVFDEVVRDISVVPPLASERCAEDFYEGQSVLFFNGTRLVAGTIKSVKAYEHRLTLGAPRELPAAAKEARLESLRTYQRDTTKEMDTELLRRRMTLEPIFQEVVVNLSPGFVHLKTAGDPAGTIMDMNYNWIITPDAWECIKSDLTYRESWLSSGSKESIREREKLAVALEEKIQEERSRSGAGRAFVASGAMAA